MNMGALSGIKVIEIGGIGPAPFASMMLADMGAEVLVIRRSHSIGLPIESDITMRGKKIVSADLKSTQGFTLVRNLIDHADILIEGYRPGVMERLRLGPEECFSTNPGLIYGRITGWGQQGTLANAAGHDINYIALAGALHAIGSINSNPSVPLNVIGDYGGGAMMLVTGILAALHERNHSAKGQIIDAAMTDGVSLMMSLFHSMRQLGAWTHYREENLLDGGAHFYACYETADARHIAIGAIEPNFYALLLQKLDLDIELFSNQLDKENWPNLKSKFAQIFKTKSLVEWCEILEGSDVCFSPVLNFDEAKEHHHMKSRNSFIEYNGLIQPAPAPRFSRTPSEIKSIQVFDNQKEIDNLVKSWCNKGK